MAKIPYVKGSKRPARNKTEPDLPTILEPDLPSVSEKYGVDQGIVGRIAKTLAGTTVAAGAVTASEEAEAGILTAALSPRLRQNLTKMMQGEELTKAEERAVRKYIKQVEETDDAWGARERMRMADIESPAVDVMNRPIIDPQEMVGSILVPVMGDPSIAGATLRSVEGVPLDKGVPLHGGPNYGLQAMYDQSSSAWESMYSAAATKQAHFLRASQENPGMDVFGVYTMMGPESMKFNAMTSEVALRQFPALKIPAKDIEAFDNKMREKYPDFAGVESPDALAQVLDRVPVTDTDGVRVSGGNFRKALMTEMSKAKWGNKGFPVIDDIVRATTEPDLLGGELGASGFSIFRSIPEDELIKKSRTTTYDTGIPGHYYGGLQNSIPVSLMFPRLWARTESAVTEGGVALTHSQQIGQIRTKTQDGWHEVADQQWADTISEYLAGQYENVRVQKIAKGTVAAGTVIASPFTFAEDDVDASYLNAKQEQNLTPGQIAVRDAQAARAQQSGETKGNLGFIFDSKLGRMRPRTEQDELPIVQAVVSDVARGVPEIVEQSLYGAVDAIGEVMQTLGIESDFQFTEEEYKPDTVTGGLSRGISQFLVGFIPAVRGLKAIGMGAGFTRTMAASAVADAAAFDPHGPRLADLANEYPELQGPVTDFLASDPNDSDALGRFKNAVEGLAIGGLAEGFIKAVKLIKARQVIKDVAEETGQRPSDLINETIDDAKLDDGTGAESRAMVELRAKQEEAQGEFVPFEEAVEVEMPTFEFKTGRGEATPESAQNINLSKINTSEEVEALIQAVAKNDAPIINDARRQKIFLEDLPALADDLGMTVEDLLARPTGRAQNAEEILAARKILLASGENLIRLGKKANSVDGTEMDLAVMRRAFSVHNAIQAQVSGMATEASRALNQFRVIAESSRLQEKAIKDMLSADGNSNASRTMAKMLSDLENPAQVGSFVKNGSKATRFEKFYEVYINGLVAGLGTHMTNLVGNTIVMGNAVAERYVTAGISQATRLVAKDGGEINIGEANAHVMGIVMGFGDGLRLAWNALKTGEPTDPLVKESVDQQKKAVGRGEMTGAPGMAMDFIGELVRSPGRLLGATDEFFKAIAYRMELNSLAMRSVYREGLAGDVAAKRYQEIMTNPPENLKIESVDFARYSTFTNRLSEAKIQSVGNAGAAAEYARRSGGPFGGLSQMVMPFVRTPTNIMSYTLERTPLALISRGVRADIAAGGARRDLALGKVATGSMIMAATVPFVNSGTITGQGPSSYEMRRIMEKTGWRPYSIKIGDTYYAYNRLDPIGSLLGIAADATYLMSHSSEADANELAVAISVGLVQNMGSKTYFSSVFEFMEALFSTGTGLDTSTRLKNWLYRTGSSMIPFSSAIASWERQISPEVSATYDLMDKIKARTPYMSEDLPPRRDVFGDIVYVDSGLGPDFAAVVRTSKFQEDPLIDEMVLQEAAPGMPRRNATINGATIELSPEQYDRYLILSSGDGLQGATFSLKQQLRQLIRSREYKRLSDGRDGDKNAAIKRVFRQYRQAALSQLVNEDVGLQQAITTEQLAMQAKRTENQGR